MLLFCRPHLVDDHRCTNPTIYLHNKGSNHHQPHCMMTNRKTTLPTQGWEHVPNASEQTSYTNLNIQYTHTRTHTYIYVLALFTWMPGRPDESLQIPINNEHKCTLRVWHNVVRRCVSRLSQKTRHPGKELKWAQQTLINCPPKVEHRSSN